jgi:hypothetical protein
VDPLSGLPLDPNNPNNPNNPRKGESMITKTERGELRSVVRQQLKVLRSEVRQREGELLAEIDQGIAEQYAEVDAAEKAIYEKTDQIVREANRAIGEVVTEMGAGGEAWRIYDYLTPPRLARVDRHHREALRQAARSDVASKVKTAIVRLDRTEADLLRNLSLDALESVDAREFLVSIPTVSELVPMVRLAELEASLEAPRRPPY